MIRFIAAIDEKRGIADDHGIPWQGKVPGDIKYYLGKIKTGTILMGYGVYKELSHPYENEQEVNYVAVQGVDDKLLPGYEPVQNAYEFLQQAKGDVWNVGGAILFASTLSLADELYLTRLQGDFHCTKFFPEFEHDFELASQSEPINENGITYRFEVWKRKQPQS